ncbi:ATP-binding cassette domain-containing protein [Rhodococcus sp. NPDC058521]|uniref:ABC transporter ATP-binding protein n=1 Tax=Rhodococcus sp. NPDC058521 TaxID=3346536 RepID=UPI0036624AAB
MLQVRGASRCFGALTVFSDVTFDVELGTACAIVGANGAGKSTLLRCVVGADHLDEGAILFDGEPVDESSPTFRAAVASVLDEPGFFPHLSVSEHIRLIASAHGMPDASEVAEATLDNFGMSGAADQLPVTLSSGQRRRLALASAFVRPRTTLVLDEPEQHLDAEGRARLADTLNAEKAAGVTVLLVSHDPELVDAVADFTIDGDSWR